MNDTDITHNQLEAQRIAAQARQHRLSTLVLGVTLVVIAAGSIYLATLRLSEPEWVAPVVSGLVGFVAGGASVTRSHGSEK